MGIEEEVNRERTGKTRFESEACKQIRAGI